MYRLLITGSRNWDNWDVIREALSVVHAEHGTNVILVHGCARGADTMCAAVAQQYEWTIEEHPADWDKHGRAAGPIRNAQMVALGADLCIGFLGVASKGTRHCLAQAEKAGIPTRQYAVQSVT